MSRTHIHKSSHWTPPRLTQSSSSFKPPTVGIQPATGRWQSQEEGAGWRAPLPSEVGKHYLSNSIQTKCDTCEGKEKEKTPDVQTKLTVGKPENQQEQEAKSQPAQMALITSGMSWAELQKTLRHAYHLRGISFVANGDKEKLTQRIEATNEAIRAYYKVKDRWLAGSATEEETNNAIRRWKNAGQQLDVTVRAIVIGHGPVGLSQPVPEKQLWARQGYPVVSSRLGAFTMTSGFMEPHGHGKKGQHHAIFSSRNQYGLPDNQVVSLPASDRNLGVDYDVRDGKVRPWYPGIVRVARNTGRGYGNRVIIKSVAHFKFNGKDYPIYQGYGHLQSINVRVGKYVNRDVVIGIMGGTGGNYPPHVDLRTWTDIDGKEVDISPNLIEQQLSEQFSPPP